MPRRRKDKVMRMVLVDGVWPSHCLLCVHVVEFERTADQCKVRVKNTSSAYERIASKCGPNGTGSEGLTDNEWAYLRLWYPVHEAKYRYAATPSNSQRPVVFWFSLFGMALFSSALYHR